MNQRIAKKIVKTMLRGTRYCRRSRRLQAMLGNGGYSRHQQNKAIAALSTDRLRDLVEVPVQGSLWGETTTFTPRLVSERFGDSRRLMYLSPINDRPAYFVVRVDSRKKPFEDDNDHCNLVIDAIYDAAENEYCGSSYCETCDHYVTECDEDCCFRERHFPNANFNDGSSWAFEGSNILDSSDNRGIIGLKRES